MPDAPDRIVEPVAVERLAWQKTLFAPRLNAFEILKLGAKPADHGPALRVHRNHAFEIVASALPAFLAFAGLSLRTVIGDYDDSLSFELPEAKAACELIWLDFDRYPRLGDDDLTDWLTGRLQALRAVSGVPIVVAASPGRSARDLRLNEALRAWARETPATAVLALDELAASLGPAFIDEARTAITGSRYSAAAALASARALGFAVLPGFFAAPIKAIALDLDNTLYDGVLGENGPAGVVLTDEHAALQSGIARWADKGLLLAVISRNDPGDVQALFASRPDFPLKAAHIAGWRVGWGDKSTAVLAAAEALRIAPDSVLLIDDNLGELIDAGSRVPGLRLIFAGHGPAETLRALDGYPALPRRAAAFGGRAADLRAGEVREAMAKAAPDAAAYLGALGATLTFSLDPREDRARLAELSIKTNQFNLALRRFSELDVERYLTARDRCVVHVRLADRLSDSGSVAALFAARDGDSLVVEELCISCRALGRRLEDLMVAEALRRAVEFLGCAQVAFDYAEGPRNGPARRWLEAYAGRPLPNPAGQLRLSGLPPRRDVPVTLVWTD